MLGGRISEEATGPLSIICAGLEQPTMNSPILHELIAREQTKDRLKEAEQRRLIKAGLAHQPAQRFNLRKYLGNLSFAIRHLFDAQARAD
jgi:hypothetical protein